MNQEDKGSVASNGKSKSESSGDAAKTSHIPRTESAIIPELNAVPSFTPAPWKVEIGGDRRDVIIAEATGNTVCEPNTWDENDWNDLDPTVRYISYEEGMANAHLIAAAPAMYEAATLVLNKLDSPTLSVTAFDAHKLRAALALARGEVPELNAEENKDD